MTSRDCGRLSRLGVLAPAALSACMDASVLAVPAAGAIVSTVLKELSKAFMLKKWFHGLMSAKEAEHLMMERGKNGSFLVRESLTHPGEYVLSVRVRGRVSHVMIRRQHDKYYVGSGEQFDDLVGLIEHFRSYPMIENSGDVLRLLQPVNGTCLKAKDINKKVQEMSDFQRQRNKSGFDREFHTIKMVDGFHSFTTREANKPENLSKNRYRNVIPYDQTRVIIQKPGNDYINASYVRTTRLGDSTSSVSSSESSSSVHSLGPRHDSKKKKSYGAPLVSKSLSDDVFKEVRKIIKLEKAHTKESRSIIKDKMYIATQGCLKSTVNQFWRMIWQEDVRVIAMITREHEKDKVSNEKCARYWPVLGKEEVFDDNITVKFISESCYEDYVLREFDVNDNNTCKVIYQYQYTNWPDHGVPEDPNGVLGLLNDINRKMYHITQEKDAPDQNILCVHCSAGVGRTGTFIVIDMLIDKIRSSGVNTELDVHNTVKLVRAQRNGMVQNKLQYRFIYLAVQSYVDGSSVKMQKKIYTSEA